MSVRIINPFPYFRDKRGLPLDGGAAYIGDDGDDPELIPGDVWLDEALTIAAPQPISVIGGLLAYDGNPTQFYITGPSFSIRTRDSDGAEVFYEPSAVVENTAYQPLDSDLTAIAALATTAFGRAVLELADEAAAQAYFGVTPPTTPTEFIEVAVSDQTTALTAGTGKITFPMPYALTLSGAKAFLATPQTSGSTFTVDINEGGATILSTKLTIDNTENSSVTAGVPAVVSDTTLAADAIMTVDIDTIGDGTAKGLIITLIGTKP